MNARAKLRPTIVAVHRTLSFMGIHILPRHYYSSFADLNDLQSRQKEWAYPSAMPGVGGALESQVSCLRELSEYLKEINPHELYDRAKRSSHGPGFSHVDGAILYAFLRKQQPTKVIEVGAGVSSLIIEETRSRNEKKFEHWVIDPSPGKGLLDHSHINLLTQRVQRTDLSVFTQLRSGDLLFIDSTHTVRPGSDVNYLILEVLPRLSEGVIVHFHDINFPYDYQPDLFETLFQWSEASMLRAFLIQNDRWKILLSLSMIYHSARMELERLLPGLRPAPVNKGLLACSLASVRSGAFHIPGSTFIRNEGTYPPRDCQRDTESTTYSSVLKVQSVVSRYLSTATRRWQPAL